MADSNSLSEGFQILPKVQIVSQTVSSVLEQKSYILKYSHNEAAVVENEVGVSNEYFGSMQISNFDSVTRTTIEQPYLSFIIYLDDKEIYAEKKTVTQGGITYTRIVSVLALVGGLWGPLTAIIKILLAKYTEAAFTLHIVKSIFMTKTLDEVDDSKKSPDF